MADRWANVTDAHSLFTALNADHISAIDEDLSR
jgi:hypothetical protein